MNMRSLRDRGLCPVTLFLQTFDPQSGLSARRDHGLRPVALIPA
ncbi:MAG: hypothetical protein SF052_02225 [Bacteroidia bacterium]|nr:hypothetical protein [Bacteroidia bacterium]